MSISTDTAGLPGGRLLRRLVLVAAVTPIAYAIGARRSRRLTHAYIAKLGEMQQRLDELERATTGEKERIASHYEVLANQLAYEQQLADLTNRLASVEHVTPVSTTN